MAPSAVHTPTRTAFHRFFELPAEVRLKIWGHAFPRRVINIFAYKNETRNCDGLKINPKRRKIDIEPEPEFHREHVFARPSQTALSTVSFEARSSFPNGYTHRISTEVEPSDKYTCMDNELSPGQKETCFDIDDYSSTNFININLEKDVICFRALGHQRGDSLSGSTGPGLGQCLEVFTGCVSKEVRASIRHLAINFNEVGFWTRRRHVGRGLRQDAALCSFPNLKTLYIMSEEFKMVYFSEDGRRILRGEEAKNASRKRKAEYIEEIPGAFKTFIEYFPEWNRPKVVVVQDRKALRKIVERSG